MSPDPSRSMLPVLFSVVIIDLVGFGIVMPVLPFLAESLGANGTVLGALLSSYAVMQFAFAPLWGRLSDRIGRKPVMVLTIFGTSASLALLGLSDSLVGIFAARMLAGAFAANIGVATAYITDVTAEEERTRWMGLLGASFGVGFVLGPLLGGILAPYGYGVPMLAAAGLSAANGVHAVFSLREPATYRSSGSESSGEDAAPVTQGRRQVLAHPGVRRLFLTNLAFSLAVTQLESMFAFFMNDRFAYDAREVAFVLVGMAVLMGAIQGGAIRSLAARYGERRLVLGGAALLAVSFALIPSMPSVALLVLPLAGAAVGRGVSQPSMMGMVSFCATDSNRGSVMSTFQSAGSLARAVGPVLAGWAYDSQIGAPFWMASALMLVAVALARGLPSDPTG